MTLRSTLLVGLAVVSVLGGGASPMTADGQRPSPPSQEGTLQALADRHHLAMGTAVDVAALGDPTYRQIAGTDFSTVTAENVMKWEVLEPVQGEYDWAQAEQFMAFAKANHQRVRGHVLVWNNQLPAWLTEGVADGSITRTELRDLLRQHIKTVVTHFKGRVWQWDVVNEAVTDAWDSTDGRIGYKGFWAQNLGPGYVADAFRWAREADPKALLFYNDYNIDATEVDVRNLLPQDQTGDTVNPLLQAQAYDYAALMQGCLASRRCISYTVWGFDDGHSWTNTWDFGAGPGREALATIRDTNYRPKPAYRALQSQLAWAGPPAVLPRVAQSPSR